MDLKSYVDSELEEEKELGYSPSGVSGSDGDGYPGSDDVYVPESDVDAETIRFTANGAEQSAYLVRPKGGGSAPLVIVIHENKGLVPYIKNVARRLAAEGYVAVAPDLLARVGGTDKFDGGEAAIAAIRDLDPQGMVEDVRATLTEVSGRDGVDADKAGIIGFCFGGGVAWRVLTQEPRLSAGVPFYGPTPDEEAVPDITAPVLGIYGELDERITSMLPGIREAMETHGKEFGAVVLPDAGHAFHNDTNPDRYNPEAAAKAWRTAVDFLDDTIKS
ncbi:dienelactone hydrolase family protein [Egicoccus sp. AB-alg6-2]|uniref:dienelactone hydrolase family protein n=1 Tax=Egicoccus sp. AB-alg6-2 TaxID=3242692 RepID=UPI00359EE5A4